jgi:hypothetical protein
MLSKCGLAGLLLVGVAIAGCETTSNKINLNNTEGSPFYISELAATYQTLDGSVVIYRVLVKGDLQVMSPVDPHDVLSHNARCKIGGKWEEGGYSQGSEPLDDVPKDGIVEIIAVSPNLPDGQPNALCEFNWMFDPHDGDAVTPAVDLGTVCLRGEVLSVGNCEDPS